MARTNVREVEEVEPEYEFTIARAFDTCVGHPKDDDNAPKQTFDIERGLRSVAYLLRELSDGGNRMVNGFVAEGLGLALEDYANRIGAAAGRNPKPQD